jgi:hypothetical protein
MLTKGEQQQIKALLQDPKWAVIENQANDLCDKIKYDTAIRNSEFETLKAVFMNEGQVQGIKRFIQQLYKEANEQI